MLRNFLSYEDSSLHLFPVISCKSRLPSMYLNATVLRLHFVCAGDAYHRKRSSRQTDSYVQRDFPTADGSVSTKNSQQTHRDPGGRPQCGLQRGRATRPGAGRRAKVPEAAGVAGDLPESGVRHRIRGQTGTISTLFYIQILCMGGFLYKTNKYVNFHYV